MKIDFTKMNGAGNDFVVIDCMREPARLDASRIALLCDRKHGVGADGVLLLEPDEEYDFRMRYFNRDGGEAEMCGNGARCLARYFAIRESGVAPAAEETVRFMTAAGAMQARIAGNRVALKMPDASRLTLNISLQVENREQIVHFIDTGVPHAVVHHADADALEDEFVDTVGRALRLHPRFQPDGCNVNFASTGPNGVIQIRTYERGVEQETLACGTGSVATAIVFAHLGLTAPPARLFTRGGDELRVSFELHPDGARNVVLDGPAEINFRGTISI